MDEQTARREIVNIGRLLYERSYVVSSDGNVSVRLDDGRIVATPTMICKGRMTEDSLAVTDGVADKSHSTATTCARVVATTVSSIASVRSNNTSRPNDQIA